MSLLQTAVASSFLLAISEIPRTNEIRVDTAQFWLLARNIFILLIFPSVLNYNGF